MIDPRKRQPLYSGCLSYFPRALLAVSRVSFEANSKHNGDHPLYWSKGRSTDQPDAAARHMLTPFEIDPETNEFHLASAVWRMAAFLEIALEAIERGLCTRDDLRYGRVSISELSAKLAEIQTAELADKSSSLGAWKP